MKVVRQGRQVPWWVGLYGKCDECGTILQLEEDDDPLVKKVFITKIAQLDCPTDRCDGRILFHLKSSEELEEREGLDGKVVGS